MRLHCAIFCGLLAVAGCGSDDDEEKLGLPVGYIPADSTYRYATRLSAGTRGNVLIIRLSKISMCEKTPVPDGHPFVSIEVTVPPGGIKDGTYPVDGSTNAIVVQKTHGAACSGASGAGANSGSITIKVGQDHLSGSFVGKNPDSRVDVEGLFEAQLCTSAPEQYCL